MDLPVLLYCGDRDAAFARARRAAALLPRARFVALPGRNHLAGFFDSAAALPHITAFLARMRAGVGARRHHRERRLNQKRVEGDRNKGSSSRILCITPRCLWSRGIPLGKSGGAA